MCNAFYRLLLVALLISVPLCHAGHTADQSIIFLHHSTGAGVYYDGGVEDWFAAHNADHHTSYAISERNYPDSPYAWENYPYDYWNIWINGACDSSNPNIECLDSLAAAYDVIIFKHCFPGAGIEPDDGSPDVASSAKTLENYKLQYRALRDLMDSYPDNLFILWTLAPLHRLATDAGQAARARQFVDWVTAEFLSEDGTAHPNIAIFDFWAIVAEDDPAPTLGRANCLRYEYEGSHFDSDSHPNAAANQIAGPQLAQSIVSAIEFFFGPGGDDDDDAPDNGTDGDGSGDDDDNGNGDGDDNGDGGCLAAQLLGPRHPGLAALQNFRDTVLAKSAVGQRLIALYYAREQAISGLVKQSSITHDLLRAMLETCIAALHAGQSSNEDRAGRAAN